MRVALIVGVLLAGAGGAAFYASRRLMTEQRPLEPPPAYRVTARLAGARPAELERELAEPIEKALATMPGVDRLRTRIAGDAVTISVWCPSDLDLRAALEPVSRTLPSSVDPPLVSRVDHLLDTHWIVRGEQRPRVYGEVCGREDRQLVVRLDPLKLQAMHVGALEVARALEGAGSDPEVLRKLEVKPTLRLADVAVFEDTLQPPTCLATEEGRPVWYVHSAKQELGVEATRLEEVSTVKVEVLSERVPELKAVTPKLVTQVLPGEVTYFFSPPLTAAQRAQVLGELAQVPGASVRQVDGVRRVRLVLRGGLGRDQLRDIAEVIASSLRHAPGVELVVTPAPLRPEIGIQVDRVKASELGVTVADIARLIALARRGEVHGNVRLSVELGGVPEHLGALMLGDRRLADLVTLTREADPPELLREDREPAVELHAYGIDRKGVPMPALPAGVRLEIYEEL